MLEATAAEPRQQSRRKSVAEPKAEPRRLRVLFVTENEPFFLGETFRKLVKTRPDWLDIGAVALLAFAPFGTPGGLLTRASLARTYGAITTLKTAFKLAATWLTPWRHLPRVLRKSGTELVRIREVNSAEMRALIERVDPDVIVAMGLNCIVSASMLNSGRAQWINVHLGLLPRHRGPAPLFWAMHDGDAETGVSVHMMVERVDAGAVLVQKRRPLDGALYPQIGHLRMLSIDALYEALERFGRGDIPPASDLPLPPAHRAPKRADVVRFFGAGNRIL